MSPAQPLKHELIRRDGAQDRLMLLLHGYGESAAMMTDRLDLIDPSGRFVALVPDAPFEHKGAKIWYRALASGSTAAATQYLQSLQALDQLLVTVCSTGGFDPGEVIVGGFSQGAGLALGLSEMTDEFVPTEVSRLSASVLERLGVDLTYRELTAGHAVTDEAATIAGAWLRSEIGGLGEGIDLTGMDRFWKLIEDNWNIEE